MDEAEDVIPQIRGRPETETAPLPPSPPNHTFGTAAGPSGEREEGVGLGNDDEGGDFEKGERRNLRLPKLLDVRVRVGTEVVEEEDLSGKGGVELHRHAPEVHLFSPLFLPNSTIYALL